MKSADRLFNDCFFESADGLHLYYRDYDRTGAGGVPVICLHGLTRNSRDFGPLAEALAPNHRVIGCDFRGRGRSDYDANWHNYHPAQYVEDVWKLVDDLRLERVALIGTSLGGLMSLLMNDERPSAIAGVVLNDVGPRFNPAGIARVVANAGTLPPVPDFDAAVAATRAVYDVAFPRWGEQQWRWLTDITYRQNEDGFFDLNFDRNIGVAARAGVSALRVDPWQLYGSLEHTPVLLVHGALSDILTDDIVAEMRGKKTDLEVVVVPETGHAPMLDEPEAKHAIIEFLGRVC